jgi:hypothetical protein
VHVSNGVPVAGRLGGDWLNTAGVAGFYFTDLALAFAFPNDGVCVHAVYSD